jgi:hypothetical protein
MAEAVVDVLRLDARSQHMQHVEMLHQPDEILESGKSSRPPAVLQIGDVRRPGSCQERHRAEFERQVAGTVTGMDADRFRRRGQRRRDDVAADAHHLAVLVDQSAGTSKNGARLRQQHLGAELLEHAQRRVVDRGDLVGRKDRLRQERVLQRTIVRPAAGLAAGLAGSSAPAFAPEVACCVIDHGGCSSLPYCPVLRIVGRSRDDARRPLGPVG